MRTIRSPWLRAAARMFFETRRHYYNIRYLGRVRLGPGVTVRGTLGVHRGTRVVIGADTRLRKRVRITGGGRLTVGSNTLLNGCWVGASSEVSIGDWCLISDCDISDTDYHNLDPERRHEDPDHRVTKPVRLGRNVWVGARAQVLKGVAVGDDSVVGAGAVVREDVPPGVVVIGNPAVVVKRFARPASQAEAGRAP
jgi:acetyltransferase-like isoleucine patch superfamily enzyme